MRNDALADGQLRLPAERANASRVEKDEWVVADPAALAAGSRSARADSRDGGDPADRIIDLDCTSSVPRLKILTLSLRLVDRKKHRIDAVLHVHVGFALRAVAKHVQRRRVGSEPLEEIEDMAMGVALAEHRDEAEDVALEAEALAIGLDQAFAGELRGAVERGLDRKRRVLRRREDGGLAIDRAGRGEGDRLQPFARIASSTLKVAMVFCSRSLRGCSVPKRTSALAAR